MVGNYRFLLPIFPRLHKATEQQREKYELSGGGTGLHWDEIDEDISVPNLLIGIYDQSRGPLPC